MRATTLYIFVLALILFTPSSIYSQDTNRLTVVDGKIIIDTPPANPLYIYPAKQTTKNRISTVAAINIAVNTGSSPFGPSN